MSNNKSIPAAVERSLISKISLISAIEVLEMNMSKKISVYDRFSRPVHFVGIVVLLFGILLSFSGCEKIKTPMIPDTTVPDVEPLTVMTYNVYVGRQCRGNFICRECVAGSDRSR